MTITCYWAGDYMDVNEWGLKLFKDVHDKWLSVEASSPFFESGYRVFYSPIRMNPKLMVIGYNPGGGAESFDPDDARNIPSEHDYYRDDYTLARKMRSIFQRMELESLLKESVKLNLMFFRSNNMSQWNQLSPLVRKDIEKFCTNKTVEIIKILQPKTILAEGIETYLQLKRALGLNSEDKSIESKGRSLFIENENSTLRLLGIIHPSGARVSTNEWQLITENLSRKLRNI